MFNWSVSFCLATTFCVVSTVLLVPWRRDAVSCLAASCPINSHHGWYSQSAARVLKTRCGSNSILEPCHINLRTTRKQLSAPSNDFPSRNKKKQRSSTHKLLKNSATPTAETTLQSDCGNKKHTPGTTCSHTPKRLPARRLPVQRRQHLPRCCS